MANAQQTIEYLGEGTLGGRPTPGAGGFPTIPAGGIALYYARDVGALFLWDTAGAAWITISGPSSGLTMSSKVANYGVLAADSGTHFDNVGAAGGVTFSLPTAARGLFYSFLCSAAHQVEVLAAGGDQIAQGGVNSAGGGNVASSTPFSFISLECHAAGQWIASSSQGAWVVT